MSSFDLIRIGGAALGLPLFGLGALTTWAVAREPKPLRGAALAASPEAKAYREAEAKALAHYGVVAQPLELEIELAGIDAHVHGLSVGEGPPALLLHGGGSSGGSFIPLLGHLVGRRLHVVDRPGCGLTDGFDYSGVDLRQHAIDFIGGVLDALGTEKVVLVGNSMGGLWSLFYALEHPARVEALVLLGTPAGLLGTSAPTPMRLLTLPGLGQLMALHEPTPAEARARSERILGRHALEQLPPEMVELAERAQRIPGSGRSFRTLLGRLLTASRVKPGVPPGRHELARLIPPTSLIWGDADTFADPQFPARVRDALPSANIVVLAGAGHLPWLDDARAVASAIRSAW